MPMKLAEAIEIARNPSRHINQLRLAHLKLGNAALRTYPSSPKQKELIKFRQAIEAMPEQLWRYRDAD